MEETFSKKMIGRFGICGLILIGVTAWLVFALILYGHPVCDGSDRDGSERAGAGHRGTVPQYGL